MNKILLSLLTITLVSVVAVGATRAYFSDTETSTGNSFMAGTLDLAITGTSNGTNAVKWTITNFKPGTSGSSTRTYQLNNTGSVDGYIDLENISVTNNENGCIEPESEAGDTSCGTPGAGEGELQNIIKFQSLIWDNDCDGWYDADDVKIYTGTIGAMSSSYDTSRPLNAGASQCISGQAGWWSSTSDNLAMGDDMILNMTFELAQTASQ